MPREWYDRHTVAKEPDEERRKFLYDILADKKPRFMIYIYPDLMSEYKKYLSDTNKKCLRMFGVPTEKLLNTPEEELDEEESTFLKYFKLKMPVSDGMCVTNQICRIVEEHYDGRLKKLNKESKFDYKIMKSGTKYTKVQFNEITTLYKRFNQRIRDYMIYASRERVDDEASYSVMASMEYAFRRDCEDIVNNGKQLCDILLDMCYGSNGGKLFVWKLCADEIIDNLLNNKHRKISYPVQDPEGNIEYGGRRFSMHQKIVEVND